ncbi:alkaline phosphatase family protein [Dactylosporangium sp. CA-092794]|uniref:alkaline phosphatase family protein n=1 Tax=Dactylosporangium sp. CA-092794 TaxID=3239929 RepID=UPI003D8F3308
MIATVRRLLVVGMDGVNWPQVEAAGTPHLDALAAAGAFGQSLVPCPPDVAETCSGPGWSTVATGVWPAKHGVRDNGFAGQQYGAYPDFLTRLQRADPRRHTYCAVDWAALHEQGTFGPDIHTRLTLDGEADGYATQDEKLTADAEQRLRDDDYDASFVYLGNTDAVAHLTGTGAEYRAAIEEQDRQLGRLVTAIEQRSARRTESWLVIVTTDHGHRVPSGGHGGCDPDERGTWIVASGPGIAAASRPIGTAQVDVAATALRHFGLTPPLDGRPLQDR